MKNVPMVLHALVSKYKDSFIELADKIMDEIIPFSEKSTWLKELPIVKYLVSGVTVFNVISLSHFLKKYAAFTGVINNEIDTTQSLALVETLCEKVKDFRRVMDQTLIELNRYETEFKARILGKLFIETFKYSTFTIEEYNTLLFSIDTIHPVIGFKKLGEFYDYRIKEERALSDKEKK